MAFSLWTTQRLKKTSRPKASWRCKSTAMPSRASGIRTSPLPNFLRRSNVMTDWQHHYETGDTPWNKGGPSPPLVQWLAGHRLHGRVLVPGCGHGHDLVPLAASGADSVTGLDIAPGAVVAAGERTAAIPGVSV